MIYVPTSFQTQLKHLDSIAYQYRYPSTGSEKSRTRIKYGSFSLYLQVKPLSSSRWTTVSVPNLPPGELNAQPVTHSPPPGRQRNISPSTHEHSQSTSLSSKRAALSPPDHSRDLKQPLKGTEDISEKEEEVRDDVIKKILAEM